MKRRIIGAFLGLALVVSLSSCSFIDGLIVRTTTTTTTQPTATTVTPTVTTSKQTAYESTIPSNNPNGYKIKIPNTAIAKELILKYPDKFNDYEITKGKMDDVFLTVTGYELED